MNCIRLDEEFPLMFFPARAGEARLQEIFALGAPAAIQAALEKEPAFARITFEETGIACRGGGGVLRCVLAPVMFGRTRHCQQFLFFSLMP